MKKDIKEVNISDKVKLRTGEGMDKAPVLSKQMQILYNNYTWFDWLTGLVMNRFPGVRKVVFQPSSMKDGTLTMSVHFYEWNLHFGFSIGLAEFLDLARGFLEHPELLSPHAHIYLGKLGEEDREDDNCILVPKWANRQFVTGLIKAADHISFLMMQEQVFKMFKHEETPGKKQDSNTPPTVH